MVETDLAPLTPELLERFRRRHLEELLPRVRMGMLIGAALFAAFCVWEWGQAPGQLRHSVPIRAAAILALGAIFSLSFVRALARRPYLLLFPGVAVATSAIVSLTLVLPHGDVYGTGSLLLVVLVVTALRPPPRTALFAFALLVLVALGGLTLRDAAPFILFAVGLLVGGGAVAAALMCRMSWHSDLRTFRLEMALERLASIDALSGALNRHAFDVRSRAELERAARHRLPVSLLLLDIDHFKRVNDTHGHPAGDAAIRALAEGIRPLLRQSDLFARLGGEEFAILAPHTDAESAAAFADRLREEIACRPVAWGSLRLAVTVSVGVATWTGANEPLESLLSRADRALYAAKHGGRNRVARAPLRVAA